MTIIQRIDAAQALKAAVAKLECQFNVVNRAIMNSCSPRKLPLLNALMMAMACLPAWADNHIFFGGAPLVFVATVGAFEPFDLYTQTAGGAWAKTPSARRLKTLWGLRLGGEAFAHSVLSIEPGDRLGCTSPDRVIVADGDLVGVLTSRPLKLRPDARPRAATISERSAAQAWLIHALGQRRLGDEMRRHAVAKLDVVAAKMVSGEAAVLIAQVQVELPGKAKALSVFAILHSDAASLTPEFTRIQYGPLSDSDAYAGQTALAEVVDLDDDGVSEVLIHSSLYESAWIEVLRRHGKYWVRVASGAASGC